MRIKRKILMIINKNVFLTKKMIQLNNVFRHRDMKMRRVHNGDGDPNIVYYVIRPNEKTQGLISLYFDCCRKIKWAKDNGYKPYIDMEHYKTQYNVDYSVNGTNNAWEYYFVQPWGVTKEMINKARNVVLDGWISNGKYISYGDIYSTNYNFVCDDMWKMAQELYSQIIGPKKCLGVLARGTDYIKVKPKNHPIQPNIEEFFEQIDSMLNVDEELQIIFLATEDRFIYEQFNEKYADLIVTSPGEYIDSRNIADYISNYIKNDGYIRGKDYLLRLLVLSMCKSFVGGMTSGSKFVVNINAKRFNQCYIFDKGYY